MKQIQLQHVIDENRREKVTEYIQTNTLVSLHASLTIQVRLLLAQTTQDITYR